MPDDERPDVIDEYVAPRTANEAVLAEIWADVIGIDRVGVHDNFFELGGDSILCLQIIARARAAGLSFTVLQLFEHQTVAELVELAGAPARDRRVVADQQPQTGAAALTPVQRWLLEDPPAGVDHFNQSVLLEVPAPVDANVLDAVPGRSCRPPRRPPPALPPDRRWLGGCLRGRFDAGARHRPRPDGGGRR